MYNFSDTTGDIGSAPGSLAPSDWKKWGSAALYSVGSVAAIAGLNEVLTTIQHIDFSTWVINVYGIKVSGMAVGAVLTNLVVYAISLFARDTRK